MQGIAACRFTLIPECSYWDDKVWVDEQICVGYVLDRSSFPVGRTRTSKIPQCYAADGDAVTLVGSVN